MAISGAVATASLVLTACSLPPALGGANADLFWMSVDWIGDSAGGPEVNRTLDFEDAKWTARESLFHLLVLRVDELAEAGITAGETTPEAGQEDPQRCAQYEAKKRTS